MNSTNQRGPVFVYEFYRLWDGRNFKVSFGPYRTADEAKDAFQKAYGYWPDEPISQVEYHGTQSS